MQQTMPLFCSVYAATRANCAATVACASGFAPQLPEHADSPRCCPQVPETQQEVDLLLDSNYAIISQLVRLRYSREAGKPRRVERKLMAMLEKNLAKLVACQKPSALVSIRTAQATRSMMGQAKETELGHTPAAAAVSQQPSGAIQTMSHQAGGAMGAIGIMQGNMTMQVQQQQQQQQGMPHLGGVGGGGGGMF